MQQQEPKGEQKQEKSESDDEIDLGMLTHGLSKKGSKKPQK